jgi:hypothetical protein
VKVRAFLADDVQSAGGKLYVLGAGWNHLAAPGFPARHPRLGIGVILTIESGEERSCHVSITMVGPDGAQRAFGVDQDGNEQRSLDADVQVPGSLDDVMVSMALNLDGIVLDREGDFSFVVAVNGEETDRLSFKVDTAVQGEPGSPQPPATTGGYL